MVLAVSAPMVPDCENRLVDEAIVEKILLVVALPRVPVPKLKFVENRFVELAVVENRDVEVAPPCPIEKTVVLAFVTASNKLPVPHVVSLLYGVVVPMPTLPFPIILNDSVAPFSIEKTAVVFAVNPPVPNFSRTPLLAVSADVIPAPALADCAWIYKTASLLAVSLSINIEPPVTPVPELRCRIKSTPEELPVPVLSIVRMLLPAFAM